MNDERTIVFSSKKIKATLKRFWWIIIMFAVIGIVGSVAYTIKNKDEIKNPVNPVVNNSVPQATTASSYYQADSFVYFEQLDSNEKNPSTVSMDVKTLVEYASVRDAVNEELKAKGYSLIGSGDGITSIATSNNQVMISVTGVENAERTEYIANKLADAVSKYAREKLDIKSSKVIEYAEAYEVVNGAKTYKKATDSTQETVAKEEVTNVSSENVNAELTIKDYFNKKAMLIVIGCLAASVILLIVIMCLDKKIYVREELDYVYLGNVDNEKAIELTIASLAIGLDKKGKRNVAIVSLGSSDAIMDISDSLNKKTKEVNVIGIDKLNESESAVKSLENTDDIILLIESGKESIIDIENTVARTKVAGCDTIGFLMK